MDASSKPPTGIDGWNDPPANLALAENISTKRVLLNKRVPYTNQDLTSASTTSTLSSGSASTPPSCLPSTVSEAIPSTSKDSSLTIDEIDAIFKRQLAKLEESATIEKKIIEDISKKFQVMHDEWSQDKLSVNTKQALGHIFEKLESNQIQEAFDLHVTLVRQAGGEVVRFIVGIKRFIQELQRLPN